MLHEKNNWLASWEISMHWAWIAAAFALSGMLATAAAVLYVAHTGVVEPRCTPTAM